MNLEDLRSTTELPAIQDEPNYYTEAEILEREAAIAAFNDAAFIAACNEED